MTSAPLVRTGGRPPGPAKKTGPRPGSRPYLLINLKPGERAYLEAPPGRLQPFMQQVQVDISRNGLQGKVTQTHVLGVVPSTRSVVDLVMVTANKQ